MPRASAGDKRLANRMNILNLRMCEPSLSQSEIARRVGVNPSTVRSVLERYSQADTSVEAPKAKKGAGRPQKQTKRWLRYDPDFSESKTPFWGFYRHLRILVKRNPRISTHQLANEMYQSEVRSILARPPGAVARVPVKYSHDTISRCRIVGFDPL